MREAVVVCLDSTFFRPETYGKYTVVHKFGPFFANYFKSIELFKKSHCSVDTESDSLHIKCTW
jgi:hypothetical protein